MAEGDAELSGTAIEAAANALVQLRIWKDFPVTQVVDMRQGVHGMIAKSPFLPA
jgi:acetamidase/formamidase